MRNHIRRRSFITLLGGAAAAWPLAARAQQDGKTWRIGYVSLGSRQSSAANYAAFQHGMSDFGYIEGKDFVLEYRFAGASYEGLPDIAAELVQLGVDVVIAGPTPAIRALQRVTRTIPIVMVGATDPVGNGLIASLARPGSNTTGLASSYDDTSPKQLELLTMVAPKSARIALLGNPDNAAYPIVRKATQEAAQKAGISLVPTEARNGQEIEQAFADFDRARVGAVMLVVDAVFISQRQQLAQLAFRHRLPAMFPQREFVEDGGLMSYGESLREFFQRAATYVHKLMRGAKAADLPVEQPTRFHLVINRKTADALGITIPPILYIFADEVIE